MTVRSISSSAPLFLLLASGALVGADCLGGIIDDPNGGDPVLVATDGGQVARLAGGDGEAVTVWTGEVPQTNRVSIVKDESIAFVGAGAEVAAFALDGAEAIQPDWRWSAPDDVVALAGPGSGAVFVMTTSTLHALATADGGELWSIDLLVDLSGVSDDALAFGGGALILGGDPTRRIDPATGAVTHELNLSSSDVSDVLVVGGTVYIAAASGVVAASAAALASAWNFDTGAPVDAIAVAGGLVAYAERGGVVGTLTEAGAAVADNGAADVYDGLLLVENVVVAARSDGGIFAFDDSAFTEVWSDSSLSGPVGGLSANAQTVFYGHGDVLEALNLSDGSAIWSLSTQGDPMAVLAF